MLDLPFEQDSFDLVIEKNHDGDPWNPNPTTVNNVMKMLEGIHRVLKPEGHTFDGDSLKLLDLLGILSTAPLAMASIISFTPFKKGICADAAMAGYIFLQHRSWLLLLIQRLVLITTSTCLLQKSSKILNMTTKLH
ncbi:hypothetical protein ACP4OV_007329 [Aristida adscensionis]